MSDPASRFVIIIHVIHHTMQRCSQSWDCIPRRRIFEHTPDFDIQDPTSKVRAIVLALFGQAMLIPSTAMNDGTHFLREKAILPQFGNACGECRAPTLERPISSAPLSLQYMNVDPIVLLQSSSSTKFAPHMHRMCQWWPRRQLPAILLLTRTTES